MSLLVSASTMLFEMTAMQERSPHRREAKPKAIAAQDKVDDSWSSVTHPLARVQDSRMTNLTHHVEAHDECLFHISLLAIL